MSDAQVSSPHQVPAEIDVLIPTRNRRVELATTLAGVAAQTGPSLRVVVSDQSDDTPSFATASAATLVRALRRRGTVVELVRNPARRGIAEQRAFLLAKATADAVLYLDDDVWLEPGVLDRLHRALTELRWGFVAADGHGEDVLSQQRVMARRGGAGVLPSGAYHQESPTTLPVRSASAVDVLGGTGPS